MLQPDARKRRRAPRGAPPRATARSGRSGHCRGWSGAETARNPGTPARCERCSGGRKTDGPAISRSLSSTRPELCGSMPAAIRSSVVLPEPEGPSRQSTSPGSAVKRDIRQGFAAGTEGMADVFEGELGGEGDAGRDPRGGRRIGRRSDRTFTRQAPVDSGPLPLPLRRPVNHL